MPKTELTKDDKVLIRLCKRICFGGSENGMCKCENPLDCAIEADTRLDILECKEYQAISSAVHRVNTLAKEFFDIQYKKENPILT